MTLELNVIQPWMDEQDRTLAQELMVRPEFFDKDSIKDTIQRLLKLMRLVPSRGLHAVAIRHMHLFLSQNVEFLESNLEIRVDVISKIRNIHIEREESPIEYTIEESSYFEDMIDLLHWPWPKVTIVHDFTQDPRTDLCLDCISGPSSCPHSDVCNDCGRLRYFDFGDNLEEHIDQLWEMIKRDCPKCKDETIKLQEETIKLQKENLYLKLLYSAALNFVPENQKKTLGSVLQGIEIRMNDD